MKKRNLFYILLLLSVNLFSNGSLVIIGGALHPKNNAIYEKFIELGGGINKIKIAIIPAASSIPYQNGIKCKKNFLSYGVPEHQIKVFPIALFDDPSTLNTDESRWGNNGSNRLLAEEIKDYTAVFFIGGDQVRYAKTLLDSNGNDLPVLKQIRHIYINGGVIGGTSAGAAIMSDPMIISGNPLKSICFGTVFQKSRDDIKAKNNVIVSKGFGFLKDVVVDQHFFKRGRIGRLIPVLKYLKKKNKKYIGIGIDEDTAIVYKRNKIEVLGSSGVLIVDISKSNIDNNFVNKDMNHVLLHYLESGDSMNLNTSEFKINLKRKLIKKGKEYYSDYSLNTNIFGKDSFKDFLTRGLIDNIKNKSEGLSFFLDKKNKGRGIYSILKKTKKTFGYFGKIDGVETFSGLNILMYYYPISLTVKK